MTNNQYAALVAAIILGIALVVAGVLIWDTWRK